MWKVQLHVAHCFFCRCWSRCLDHSFRFGAADVYCCDRCSGYCYYCCGCGCRYLDGCDRSLYQWSSSVCPDRLCGVDAVRLFRAHRKRQQGQQNIY
ncbi:hypothetical protein PR003_g11086 [Phytophthora rubi]|uniref:Secreted protein n=1 Tax=Phytophthora rubi TaxID=129364 RepID=A0A6A4FBW1_9STRA|nr:hypothetical protein PR001_g20639 [Phytophthora rubi]KAE9028577.1 hypothetical protein PR002_g10363 [Phytophthora rubi]KAE9339290.1 hypothetical protein PR003_g11086 [Phytophthora rubi]